jgi:hypothetical protein
MANTVGEKKVSIGCYFSRLMDKRRSIVLPVLRPSYAACRGARQKIVVTLTFRKNNKNRLEWPGELIVQVGGKISCVYKGWVRCDEWKTLLWRLTYSWAVENKILSKNVRCKDRTRLSWLKTMTNLWPWLWTGR